MLDLITNNGMLQRLQSGRRSSSMILQYLQYARSLYSLYAGNILYRVIPAKTRDLGSHGLL